jgi:ribosome-associated protein
LDKLQQLVVEGAQDKKAFDILVLDLKNRSDITDCFIICSGNTKIHAQAIADSILEQTYGTEFKSTAIEGYYSGNWIVIDLADLIVHVFQKEVRNFYNLERVWGDAPVIETISE